MSKFAKFSFPGWFSVSLCGGLIDCLSRAGEINSMADEGDNREVFENDRDEKESVQSEADYSVEDDDRDLTDMEIDSTVVESGVKPDEPIPDPELARGLESSEEDISPEGGYASPMVGPEVEKELVGERSVGAPPLSALVDEEYDDVDAHPLRIVVDEKTDERGTQTDFESELVPQVVVHMVEPVVRVVGREESASQTEITMSEVSIRSAPQRTVRCVDGSTQWGTDSERLVSADSIQSVIQARGLGAGSGLRIPDKLMNRYLILYGQDWDLISRGLSVALWTGTVNLERIVSPDRPRGDQPVSFAEEERHTKARAAFVEEQVAHLGYEEDLSGPATPWQVQAAMGLRLNPGVLLKDEELSLDSLPVAPKVAAGPPKPAPRKAKTQQQVMVVESGAGDVFQADDSNETAEPLPESRGGSAKRVLSPEEATPQTRRRARDHISGANEVSEMEVSKSAPPVSARDDVFEGRKLPPGFWVDKSVVEGTLHHDWCKVRDSLPVRRSNKSKLLVELDQLPGSPWVYQDKKQSILYGLVRKFKTGKASDFINRRDPPPLPANENEVQYQESNWEFYEKQTRLIIQFTIEKELFVINQLETNGNCYPVALTSILPFFGVWTCRLFMIQCERFTVLMSELLKPSPRTESKNWPDQRGLLHMFCWGMKYPHYIAEVVEGVVDASKSEFALIFNATEVGMMFIALPQLVYALHRAVYGDLIPFDKRLCAMIGWVALTFRTRLEKETVPAIRLPSLPMRKPTAEMARFLNLLVPTYEMSRPFMDLAECWVARARMENYIGSSEFEVARLESLYLHLADSTGIDNFDGGDVYDMAAVYCRMVRYRKGDDKVGRLDFEYKPANDDNNTFHDENVVLVECEVKFHERMAELRSRTKTARINMIAASALQREVSVNRADTESIGSDNASFTWPKKGRGKKKTEIVDSDSDESEPDLVLSPASKKARVASETVDGAGNDSNNEGSVELKAPTVGGRRKQATPLKNPKSDSQKPLTSVQVVEMTTLARKLAESRQKVAGGKNRQPQSDEIPMVKPVSRTKSGKRTRQPHSDEIPAAKQACEGMDRHVYCNCGTADQQLATFLPCKVHGTHRICVVCRMCARSAPLKSAKKRVCSVKGAFVMCDCRRTDRDRVRVFAHCEIHHTNWYCRHCKTCVDEQAEHSKEERDKTVAAGLKVRYVSLKIPPYEEVTDSDEERLTSVADIRKGPKVQRSRQSSILRKRTSSPPSGPDPKKKKRGTDLPTGIGSPLRVARKSRAVSRDSTVDESPAVPVPTRKRKADEVVGRGKPTGKVDSMVINISSSDEKKSPGTAAPRKSIVRARVTIPRPGARKRVEPSEVETQDMEEGDEM